jgi:hypothetical protein
VKRKLRKGRNDFLRGYVCALCCILNSHGPGTEVEDALKCAGQFDWSEIDAQDRETLLKHGYELKKDQTK